MKDISQATIREFCSEDWDEVRELRERVGLSSITAERHRKSLATNPAMLNRSGTSNGWVIESDGRIVGYLGSIPLLFRFENSDVIAAAASAFAVDHDHRSSSLKLTAAFFNQKNIDLLLVTTANKEAEQIFKFFKAKPIAQKEYDQVLFYICNLHNFLKAALIKKGLPSAFSYLCGIVLTPFFFVERIFNNRVPKQGGSSEIRVICVESFGDEFDKLWERKTAADPQRLYAYRTSSFLRWHFERFPEQMVKILCAYHLKTLVGYAVVLREEVSEIGLIRYKIVDLFVEDDNIDTIDQLIQASYYHAKKDGASILEMIGFPDFVRSRFAIGNPYSRLLPSWPYLYKSMDKAFGKALKFESAWYASPFDGDASL